MEKRTRNTEQRRVILEELLRLDTHPTASELHVIVRRRLPRISLGTVYRNLDLLVQQGMARKLDAGGGQARYDGDLERHFHLRCVACGRVFDLPVVDPDLGRRWLAQIGSVDEGHILDLHVEFMGICRTCDGRIGKKRLAQMLQRWRPNDRGGRGPDTMGHDAQGHD